MPRRPTSADQSAAAYGARVRASGRALVAADLRRDPRYRPMIRCLGWSRVWAAAQSGWAAENARRCPSNQGGES